MQMVGMSDYEGWAGFGSVNPQEVAELNKALNLTYMSPVTAGPDVLRPQSLEATLRILTFSQEHIRLWRDVVKTPAYSTTEEYNIQTAYGGEAGAFTNKGEAPQVQDSAYERRAALIKFMGVQGEVPHPDTLVKSAHGNIVAIETANKAIWLLERLERALFAGRSDVVPQSFDGFDQQIRTDSFGGPNMIIDMRGRPLQQENIEEGFNLVVENYGRPTELNLAPRGASDLAKEFYAKQRVMLPSAGPGVIGMEVTAIQTQQGRVPLKTNIFLRSGKNNGVKRAPSSATAVRAPTAPTISLGTSTPGTASQFAAGDAGSYRYRATSLNRFGESAASAAVAAQAVVAGDEIDITITDGGGGDGATGYRLYRSLVWGAAGTEQFVYEVPRVGGAATTASADTNRFLPGTSKAYLFQNNLQAMGVRQLGPMMKIPFATQAVSIRWAQVIYLTCITYAMKHIIYDNVADD